MTPLFVREGGTMATAPYMEKILDIPAIHIPLGAASCNAHLPNERIGIKNLVNGIDVMKKLFVKLGDRLSNQKVR